MSEHVNTPNDQPNEAELRKGYTMQPEQTLVLDPQLKPGQRSKNYPYVTADGRQITGRPVAILSFRDGEHNFAEATVIDLGARPGQFAEDVMAGVARHDYALFVASHQTGVAVVEPLERDQPWGVGRAYEGQEKLPESVADKQCVVGIDDYDQLVIQNLDPHSETVVQTF